jgi:hypothetical protein
VPNFVALAPANWHDRCVTTVAERGHKKPAVVAA